LYGKDYRGHSPEHPAAHPNDGQAIKGKTPIKLALWQKRNGMY
jgi:hypothetical protein